MKRIILRGTIVIALGWMLAGCQTVQYKTLEAFGVEKRDMLANRVEDARDAQKDAGEQFETTLERFRSVVNFDGGDLEKVYNRLSREYDRSVDDAERVRSRIKSIEQVSGDLFAEWERELEQYSSADLRRKSRDMLVETQGRYRDMITKMRAAEQAMDPVLAAFQDQVLFLKHNLNAMAIESIQGELATIEDETQALVAAMQDSIAEADRFLASLK